MRKIGLIFLSIISFIITQQTIKYLQKKDSIMNFLEKEAINYYVYPDEAIIKDNTIIPGVNGRKVNINDSYKMFKMVGSFNNYLLVYNNVSVKDKLINNMDKYIILGNPKKNMVSIFLYLDNINNIKKYNIPLNYIVSYQFFWENYDKLVLLINSGCNIIIQDVSIKNINNYSVKIDKTKQKNNYCFNENMDDNFKNICYKNNFYSISSNVIKSNYLSNVKKKLKSGSFIVLKGNYNNELINIINYINSKGYTIVNLDNHLDEGM